MAMQRTTFSPRCCCGGVVSAGAAEGGKLWELSGAYGDLQHQLVALVIGLQGVQNGRELGRVELDCSGGSAQIPGARGSSMELGVGGILTVHDGTDDLQSRMWLAWATSHFFEERRRANQPAKLFPSKLPNSPGRSCHRQRCLCSPAGC